MHVQGQWGIGRDSRVSGNVSDGDVLTLYFTSLGESHEAYVREKRMAAREFASDEAS